jgi:DnaJ family protein C protein 19
MGALILIAAAALVYGWYSGKLKGLTYEDLIAAAVFLLGLRFLTTAQLLPGAALMAGALCWAAFRRPKRQRVASMPIEEARALLGVGPEANLADIRSAHRRLIARVHPDAGGSAELAHRVNAARDTLIVELNRRTPRAS